MGLLTTADVIIVPDPADVPLALLTTTVVVVDAVTMNVPLFPAFAPVNPATVIDAPFHPLLPAPVVEAMV
jgi:hypothetical protein